MHTNSVTSWNEAHRTQLKHAVDGILKQYPDGLSLYELIQQLTKPPTELFSKRPLAEPQGLFQTNFVVMNTLYTLDQEQPQYHYEIHSLKIERSKIQPNDKSSEPSQGLANQDPLANYYLDWNNFQQSDEQINDLLNQFWEKLLVVDFEDADLQKLDLEKPTTRAEIKQSYRSLSQQHHPDKGGNSEVFVEIQEAYQRLMKQY